MIQQMLAIWSLVPLPFLNPAWISGSSQFTYCWSLTWRILSITLLAYSSVHCCHSVTSDSLWSHGLQHARPPCPSPTPGAYSNSCPLSWWCHPTISSSVVPFSSCLQSFPESKSLLACKMRVILQWFEHFLVLPFFQGSMQMMPHTY